jgi:phosphotriesterase-related protein
MKKGERKGKVQTTLGVIEPDDLGITLMHEHLLTDVSVFFQEPEEATAREMAHQLLTLENLHWVRYNFLTNVDNLKFNDEELAVKEAMRFKLEGGCSIVEMSSIGLCRDPRGLARISRATGLNIIMGTGFYIGMSQKPEVQGMSENELVEIIVRDITAGADDTGIKAGLIGEVGCVAPVEGFEVKSLRASAIAQQETGAMINIHPSHRDNLVLENVRILKEAGANLNRVVVSHVDGWNFTMEVIQQLLDRGCCVEYDHFGFEGYYPPYHGYHLNTPTDETKIKAIMKLIEKGYIDQIVIGSDHCMKILLASYGGGGYDHILRNAVPLMRINGMTDDQIDTLLVENPKKMLMFDK